MHRFRLVPALLALLTLPLAAACGSSADAGQGSGTLRLGYFANVTHAGAVYGVGSGLFAGQLGATKLKTQVFNAGPAEVEALFSGNLDAGFLGPGPAINAYVRSKGDAIRIVSGATSGGASLVVKPGITSAAQLRGKRLADPQTGGTQDIALRTYLKDNGFQVDARGSGDVTVQASENAATLSAFTAGQIDGAWVPEPWASRLVLEGGGKVLVDEKTRWPQGRFATTVLVVRRQYLADHPATVKALLTGLVASDKAITQDSVKAKQVVNSQIGKLTGKALTPAVLDRAFTQIRVGEDPLASSLKQQADHAFATGLVKQGNLHGIYDLTLLRQVVGTAIDDAGLGKGSS